MKSELVKMWEGRIKEIEETGNCMNSNVHRPEPYFGGNNKKHTPDEMIAFCRRMIERLEET